MSTIDVVHGHEPEGLDSELKVALELDLKEAEALRAWLLKASVDGASCLDEPVVNGTLARLSRAVDEIHATMNVRRELEQAGLDIAHLSDEQVRELGRRIYKAAAPGIRT
jgi:hypothetical protein